MDELISPLVLKGQSLYHISTHYKEEISCSERTLYNYFNNNVFTARNIDLPIKAKLSKIVKISHYRIKRTFEDFTNFIESNSNTPAVKIDIVYGTRNGKVLLTFVLRIPH